MSAARNGLPHRLHLQMRSTAPIATPQPKLQRPTERGDLDLQIHRGYRQQNAQRFGLNLSVEVDLLPLLLGASLRRTGKCVLNLPSRFFRYPPAAPANFEAILILMAAGDLEL